jgi:hypothetical protein
MELMRRSETMFGLSLPSVVCWSGLMSYLCYLCLFAHSSVQYMCCVFVLFVFVLCTLCLMPPSLQIKYTSSLCATLCYNLSLLIKTGDNRKWTIKRNCQHRVHNTKTNKTKTQRNCQHRVHNTNTNKTKTQRNCQHRKSISNVFTVIVMIRLIGQSELVCIYLFWGFIIL